MQGQQLPTECQVLEDEVLPGAESADQPAEEMSERHDHGKNFTGRIRIQLFAKSLILQVHDVLARHTCLPIQTHNVAIGFPRSKLPSVHNLLPLGKQKLRRELAPGHLFGGLCEKLPQRVRTRKAWLTDVDFVEPPANELSAIAITFWTAAPCPEFLRFCF